MGRKPQRPSMTDQELQEIAQALTFDLLEADHADRGVVLTRAFRGRADVASLTQITGATVATLCGIIDVVRSAEGGEDLIQQIIGMTKAQTLVQSVTA